MSAPSVPPPLPADRLPPPKRGMPKWLLVTLIVAGVAAIPCIAGIIGTVAIVVPQMQERQKKLTCAQNLSQLVRIYVAERAGSPDWEPESGTALFLAWRKARNPIREGEEPILLCPADPLAAFPLTPEALSSYDTVDPASAPPGLCSYAGRDYGAFPLSKDAASREPVGACIHHRDGANVAFDDGRTQFLSRADLGLAPGDPIDVGPQSKSPLLRKLCFHPGRAGR